MRQAPYNSRTIQPHEFCRLPVGFEYQHEISEVSNATAFNNGVNARDGRRCVVCGRKKTVHIQAYNGHILYDEL
jgi:hypothetical protein